MAFSINRATLLGNLSRDPELRMTKTGKGVLTLNMVTNHSYKGQDGNYIDTPTFHKVIVWGKITDWLSKNLHKGDKVYVDGRISTSEYKDKDDKVQRSREIIAENIVPMTSKQVQNTEVSPTKQGQEATPATETVPEEGKDTTMTETVNPSDIPF